MYKACPMSNDGHPGSQKIEVLSDLAQNGLKMLLLQEWEKKKESFPTSKVPCFLVANRMLILWIEFNYDLSYGTLLP